MGFFNNYTQDGPDTGSRKMLFGIICVNVLFFLAVAFQKGALLGLLILTTAAIHDGQLWRLFSSLLVNFHGFNLFFEMFALYIFGTIITPRLSAGKILSLYLFSGLAGNLLWLALSSRFGSPYVFGCSGAVNGIIMASAMMAPNLQLYLLFIPFPVKLRTMAVVFMLLNLLMGSLTPFALLDVGGFLGGYLFMRLFLRRLVEWDMLDFLTGGGKEGRARPVPYEFNAGPRPQRRTDEPDISRQEVDRILDKLSRTGINSLTPEEVKVLERVREQMNRKN